MNIMWNGFLRSIQPCQYDRVISLYHAPLPAFPPNVPGGTNSRDFDIYINKPFISAVNNTQILYKIK